MKDYNTMNKLTKKIEFQNFHRQSGIKRSAKKERLLRSRSPIFMNGVQLALLFEKLSGAHLALARKRAPL